MESRSLRVGRGPKCQSVYLPVQSLNILYPTAALLHGDPDPPWVLLAQPWLPERAAMPPALPQLWGPQNQPSLGSPCQHSVTLRILDFDIDYNPRGLDSGHLFTESSRVTEGCKNWSEHIYSELQLLLATVSPMDCQPLDALALSHAWQWRGTYEVFVELKRIYSSLCL